MNRTLLYSCLAAFIVASSPVMAQHRASDLPTSQLLSQPGTTFTVPQTDLQARTTVIVYGDMRFTDPANTTATDPKVRKWLVDQIAKEHPDAVLLNGDVPLAGDVKNDYEVYKTESQPWRDAKLHVYPALGNHEFHGPDAQQCLENWWNAFPQFRGRRWYSVQLGPKIYSLSLDSDASLLPESDQGRWLQKQLEDLPPTVDYVFLSLHHPPVADIQTHIEVDHNPRPNEIALRNTLSKMQSAMHARCIVSAGHIHNYERHEVDGVVYLVSGGGGAHPYFVERTKDDLYQSSLFPNYHYVKFSLQGDWLHADMYRVVDSEQPNLNVQVKETFDVVAKGKGNSED